MWNTMGRWEERSTNSDLCNDQIDCIGAML